MWCLRKAGREGGKEGEDERRRRAEQKANKIGVGGGEGQERG